MQDAYSWVVQYNDGEILFEDDAENGFASVDKEKVHTLVLLPAIKGVVSHCVTTPAGAEPVFFRRRSRIIAISAEGIEDERQGQTVHCIGWRKDDEASYLFIFPDGSTLLTNDLQAV